MNISAPIQLKLQEIHELSSRLTTRVRNLSLKVKELHDNSSIDLTAADYIAETAPDVPLTREAPSSFLVATSPENIYFWAPVIKRREDSILEDNTFILIPRKPVMHVIPGLYVFGVKNNTPKV